MTDETSSETEIKHYYGLVDTENNGWGFVEEGDERITSDFVELTEDEWQELIDAQSEGYDIVYYTGKVFAAELCKTYNISVIPDTVMTHYEFGRKHLHTEKLI